MEVQSGRPVVDTQGVPVLERVGSMLDTLDRMVEFRRERLDGYAAGQGTISDGVAGHFKKEVTALEGAKVALRFHRATVEGLEEPFTLLRAIVDAYEGPATQELKLRDAVRRAKSLLAEYGR